MTFILRIYTGGELSAWAVAVLLYGIPYTVFIFHISLFWWELNAILQNSLARHLKSKQTFRFNVFSEMSNSPKLPNFAVVFFTSFRSTILRNGLVTVKNNKVYDCTEFSQRERIVYYDLMIWFPRKYEIFYHSKCFPVWDFKYWNLPCGTYRHKQYGNKVSTTVCLRGCFKEGETLSRTVVASLTTPV